MSEKSKRLLVAALRRIESSKDLNQQSILRIEETEARIRKSLSGSPRLKNNASRYYKVKLRSKSPIS
jgi:hypothetical protein